MKDADNQSAEPGSPPSADLMREHRLQRNLKILVIGMGVLILAGLGAIAFRILQYANEPQGVAARATGGVVTPAGEIGLELPKGAKVVSISISGDRLAVHHESPAGTGIAVLDLATGRRIADIKPLEAMPRN